MEVNMKALIRRFGKYEAPGPRPNQGIYSVRCSACGEKIMSDNAGGTGVSVTKRGTAVFWHGKCQGDVWDSRMK